MEVVSSSLDNQQCTSVQGAEGRPDPPWPYGEQRAKGETSKHCFPEQTRIGVELGFPRRLSLSQMQLREASLVPFLRGALGGSCLAGGNWGSGDIAHKDFSGPICLLPEVEHVWSRFPGPATTSKAPVHREQEAAQTHFLIWQAET